MSAPQSAGQVVSASRARRVVRSIAYAWAKRNGHPSTFRVQDLSLWLSMFGLSADVCVETTVAVLAVGDMARLWQLRDGVYVIEGAPS